MFIRLAVLTLGACRQAKRVITRATQHKSGAPRVQMRRLIFPFSGSTGRIAQKKTLNRVCFSVRRGAERVGGALEAHKCFTERGQEKQRLTTTTERSG